VGLSEDIEIKEMEIECRLRPTQEYGSVLPSWNPDKTKFGRYHGSSWSGIPGFGTKKWVVGVWIEADIEQYLSEGYTEEEIVAGCLRYLNKPPPRKKYSRRQARPLYGALDEMPARWRIAAKTFSDASEEKMYIQAFIITDRRKNRYFWGEGRNQ
jgi:hypothetical protein